MKKVGTHQELRVSFCLVLEDLLAVGEPAGSGRESSPGNERSHFVFSFLKVHVMLGLGRLMEITGQFSKFVVE